MDSGASVGGIFLSSTSGSQTLLQFTDSPQVLLNHLIHGSVGFVWGTRIAAFITLFCFILGNLLIYVPPIKKTVDGTKTTFTDAPYILTVAWGFAASLGMYFPAFYVQLFARMHGMSSGLAFYSLAIMNAASVFGRVAPSWLADRWGLLEVFVPCTTLGGEWPCHSNFVPWLICLLLARPCGICHAGQHNAGRSRSLRCFVSLFRALQPGILLTPFFSYGFFFGASVALYLPIIDSLTPAGANKGYVVSIEDAHHRTHASLTCAENEWDSR